jgi:hypothetical protein
VLGKFLGAKRSSADEQAAGQNGTQTAGENGAETATVVAPVATTTQDGTPAMEWASLGRVPVAQCVPASPTFSPYEGQLSPVTAATVARLLGTKQES